MNPTRILIGVAIVVIAGIVVFVRLPAEPNGTKADEDRSPGGAKADSAPTLQGSVTAEATHASAVAEKEPRAGAWVARDLETGDALPDFAVRMRVGAQESVVTSGSGGRLEVPGAGEDAEVEFVGAVDPAWSLARPRDDATDDVWWYRSHEIVARVTSDDPARALPPDVVVTTRHAFTSSFDAPDPWNDGWMRSADVRPRSARFERDAEADAWRGTVPRVRGLLVVASARGWRGSKHELLPGETSATVRMRPLPALEGRLLDAAGRPVAHQAVTVATTQSGFEDSRSLGSLVIEGFSFSSSTRAGTGNVVWKDHATTDGAGAFRAYVPEAGEVVVTAFVPGHLPVRRSWSHVDADTWADLRLQAASPRRVRMLEAGSPLVNLRFHLSDVTRPDVQTGGHLQADAQGYAPAEWLERGRAYLFNAGGGRNGLLIWDGRDAVDLSTLEQNYTVIESELGRR